MDAGVSGSCPQDVPYFVRLGLGLRPSCVTSCLLCDIVSLSMGQGRLRVYTRRPDPRTCRHCGGVSAGQLWNGGGGERKIRTLSA